MQVIIYWQNLFPLDFVVFSFPTSAKGQNFMAIFQDFF